MSLVVVVCMCVCMVAGCRAGSREGKVRLMWSVRQEQVRCGRGDDLLCGLLQLRSNILPSWLSFSVEADTIH